MLPCFLWTMAPGSFRSVTRGTNHYLSKLHDQYPHCLELATSVLTTENIDDSQKNGPSIGQSDGGVAKICVRCVSQRLEFRGHELVCSSSSIFAPYLIPQLLNHLLAHGDTAVSCSRTSMCGASPHVDWGCTGWKILLLLSTNGVVVPVIAIFVQALLY